MEEARESFYYLKKLIFSEEELSANEYRGAAPAGSVWDAISQRRLADLHRSNYRVIAQGK